MQARVRHSMPLAYSTSTTFDDRTETERDQRPTEACVLRARCALDACLSSKHCRQTCVSPEHTHRHERAACSAALQAA